MARRSRRAASRRRGSRRPSREEHPPSSRERHRAGRRAPVLWTAWRRLPQERRRWASGALPASDAHRARGEGRVRGARGSHREVFRVHSRQDLDDLGFDPGDDAPGRPRQDGDDPLGTWEGEEIVSRGRRGDRRSGTGRGTGRARRVAVVAGSLAALALVLSIERSSTSTVPAHAPLASGPVSHSSVVPGPGGRDRGSANVFSARAGAPRRSARVLAAGRSNAPVRPAPRRPAVPTFVPAPVPARVHQPGASPALSEFGFER